jgi:hypothetical protein
LRRSIARALAIQSGLNAVPEQLRTMDAKWRSPRFLSRAQQADAGMKQLAAVPWLAESSIGLELLGLDAQQIERAMADKRRAEGRGVLASLRDAAARNAQPVTPVADDA